MEFNKNNNFSREFPLDETSNEPIKESNENDLSNISPNTCLTNFDSSDNKIEINEADNKESIFSNTLIDPSGDFNIADTNNIDDIDKIDNIANITNVNVDDINNTKNKNSEVFNDIKHILTSALRTKLLISLFSSKKDLKSLRNDLDKPATSILHGIKELRKLKLIKKEDKFYTLSSNGTILAANILNLIENTSSINNNFEFWKHHTIEDIPRTFLKKIYHIHNARPISFIDSSVGGFFADNSNEYLELVSKSKDIKILTPLFFDIQLDMIINNLDIDRNLELITTEEILDFMKNNGYGFKLLSLEKDVNIKIWKFPKDFKLFLTSCENFASLGLFSDEYYDDSCMLLDENKRGIKWGLELFEYYKKHSDLVDIKEYFDIFEGHE